jgi:regulatory protein
MAGKDDKSELYKIALAKAMALCSGREYCTADISSKLVTWGIENGDCDSIINRLKEENFINETRYAAAFARDKFRYNKWGRIKIAMQLRYKRIPETIISEALGSIDEESYLSTLKSMLAGHKKSVKARDKYEMKSKLMRFAQSRGFESNKIYDVLNENDTEI